MLKVGILIFDDVEVLDFCGPFEVFSIARKPSESSDDVPLFEAITVAEEDRLIVCRGGLLVQPHYTISNHARLDIVVVPGGQGTRREMHNTRLLDWIEAQAASGATMTSVCTGAFLLAEKGMLDGRSATTHWGSVDWLSEHYPQVNVLGDTRVVDTGDVITSAGVSAGIDMALSVVRRLHGEETAAWTARRMEYDYSPVPTANAPIAP